MATAISHFTFVGTCIGTPQSTVATSSKGNRTTMTMFYLANRIGSIRCVAYGNMAKKCLIKCLDKNVVSVEGYIKSNNRTLGMEMRNYFVIEDIVQIYRGKPIELDPTDKLKKAYDPKYVLKEEKEENND